MAKDCLKIVQAGTLWGSPGDLNSSEQPMGTESVKRRWVGTIKRNPPGGYAQCPYALWDRRLSPDPPVGAAHVVHHALNPMVSSTPWFGVMHTVPNYNSVCPMPTWWAVPTCPSR